MNESNEKIGRIIGGLVLIGIGGLFLANQVFGINLPNIGELWPLFILVPGVALLVAGLFARGTSVWMVVPGAVVTVTGGILLVMNMFGHWEAWAYIWALYPIAAGLGTMYAAYRTGNEKQYRDGRIAVRSGVIMLLVFGAFFELFIFRDAGNVGTILFPVLLIGAGVLLLFRNQLPKPLRSFLGESDEKDKRKNDDDYLDEAI